MKRIFGLLVATLVGAAGCGDDGQQMMAGGAGGTSGAGGMAGAGGAGGMAGTGGTGGTAGTGGSGGNPFISHPAASRIEAETHLAVSGQKIVAAWIGEFLTGSQSTNGYRVSLDGGLTWLGAQPQRVDSINAGQASDPVVAADSQGNFYIIWIGYIINAQGQTTDEHIYVAKMPAGMNTFDNPSITDVAKQPPNNTGISMDKPWIVVDANDVIYVTWGELQPGRVIRFNRSTDHGATWGTPGTAAGFGNLAYPCVDPGSTASPIYVTYFQFSSNPPGPVRIAKSIDGMTFNQGVTVTTNNVFQDPTCAVRGNDVWVLSAPGTAQQTSAMMPPATGVRVSHSSDSAATFGSPVTVSNGASGQLYLIPQLNINAAGTLAVTYYQGTMSQPALFKKAISTNGGASWTVSDVATAGTFTIDRAGNAGWFGDYTGLIASGNTFYQTYVWNTLNCPNSTTALCGHVVFTTF